MGTVGSQPAHHVAYGRRGRGGLAVPADHQVHAAHSRIAPAPHDHGQIRRGTHLFAQPELVGVPHHAHHVGELGLLIPLDPLAQRGSAQVGLLERLVHQGHGGAALPVRALQVTPPQERLSDGPQVVRAHGLVHGHRGQLALVPRLPLDVERAAVGVAFPHRGPARQPHARHARERGDLVGDALVEGGSLGVAAPDAFAQAHPHREHARGIEAGVDAAEPIEAAQHEPRSHQEHEGEGELGRHQEGAGPMSLPAVRGRPPAVAQDARQRARPVAQQGQGAQEEAGRDGDRRREGEGGAVHGDLAQAGKGAGPVGHEERHAAPRQQDPDEAAGRTEQHRLREEARGDPPRSGAHGGAHGQLLLARLGAHEEEVGDVGARDEEHEADRAQDDPQRRATSSPTRRSWTARRVTDHPAWSRKPGVMSGKKSYSRDWSSVARCCACATVTPGARRPTASMPKAPKVPFGSTPVAPGPPRPGRERRSPAA